MERSLTRAGYNDDNLTEGSFGLFLTTKDDETNPRYNATNMQFAHNGTAWTAAEGEEQLLWKNNSAEVSYYAYMPYKAAATTNPESYTVTVPTDQSTEDKIKEADFLYYKHEGRVTATSGTEMPGAIDIEFRHQLSYFTVKLKRLGTAEGIRFTSVTLQGCATSTTFKLDTGALATVTEANERKEISLLHATESKTLEKETSDTFECILIPQGFQSKTILITGTDGNNKEKTFKYVSPDTGDLVLAGGKSYTLELNVGNNYVTTNTVSVAPWGTDGWTIEDNADEWSGIDASTHTIDLSQAGQLTTTLIEEAVAGGTDITLTLSGPMDEAGAQALLDYFYGETSPKDTHVSILDMSGVTELTEIKDQTFRNAKYLKKVTLPASVTSIGAGAFIGSGLETLTANNVTNVGHGAFSWCEKLTELSLSSVTTFGNAQFTLEHCTSLTTLKLTSPDFDGAFPSDFFRDTSTANVDLYVHQNLESNKRTIVSAKDGSIIGYSFIDSNNSESIDFKSITLMDDNGNPVDKTTL